MGQESLVNYLNYRKKKKKKNWDIWEPFPELRVKTLSFCFFFLLEQRQWVCFSLWRLNVDGFLESQNLGFCGSDVVVCKCLLPSLIPESDKIEGSEHLVLLKF